MKTAAAILVTLILTASLSQAGGRITIESVKTRIQNVEKRIHSFEPKRQSAWMQVLQQQKLREHALDTPPPLDDKWLNRFGTIQTTLYSCTTRLNVAKRFLRKLVTGEDRDPGLLAADEELMQALEAMDELALKMKYWD